MFVLWWKREGLGLIGPFCVVSMIFYCLFLGRGKCSCLTALIKKLFSVMIRSFVPPVRDEESETQRKAHAKRVRETRRSTQGVTLEEVKTAEQLAKKKQAETVSCPSSSFLTPNIAGVVSQECVNWNESKSGGKTNQTLLCLWGRHQYLRRSPPMLPNLPIRNPNWNGGHPGDCASTITIRTRLATL